MEYRFHEIGNFYVNTHAYEKTDGRWATFVFFEHNSAAIRDRAAGVRHHINVDSATEGEAIERGIQYAHDCVKRDDTGL